MATTAPAAMATNAADVISPTTPTTRAHPSALATGPGRSESNSTARPASSDPVNEIWKPKVMLSRPAPKNRKTIATAVASQPWTVSRRSRTRNRIADPMCASTTGTW